MSELPLGTVTFLFSDLEVSTRLWEEHPEAMHPALARHDAILREAVAAHDGHLVKGRGDGIHAVFATAHDALDAAVEGQLALTAESFGDTGPLRVRMGVHTCEAEYRDGDYFGSEVNRAARLMSVAHGGQVVVSLATSTLVRDGSVELVDLGEHRLRDLTNLEHIFQLVAPGLARDFPPLRTLDVLPGNLPRQLTSFVGRDAEISSVADLVRSSSVVTLTGVGGVGKTRLALQVAADVVPDFRDGAWFAELAGVRDPDAVPDALVAMFGLQPRTGVSATDALVEFLAGKELLLVLDNCEHLLRAVAGLVDQVVRGSPDVRVLATSREGLNVAGERMLGVASLDVPAEAAALEAIEQCDAVKLFVERARAVKASFALDATNADAVAQVCRRLDGIALAIELAAARVAMLTPADIARRLDSRFRLLAGGQRTAVERHQTLRAAIDWSYELLGDTERLLLSRLSVFTGGFSLEAAEAVTTGDAIDTDDVFELLAALVAQSLVEADTEGVDARYRLLETIRQYAQEHLDASGDGNRLRSAHAAYYARLAEAAVPRVLGSDGIEWERRLAREADNLRAALTWATDTDDVDAALGLLGMWEAPYTLPDASFSTTIDAALALPGASDHPRYPAALGIAGLLAWARGDLALGRRRSDEALVAEQHLGTDPNSVPWIIRANVAIAGGRSDEATEYIRHAVTVARARGEPARFMQTLAVSALTHSLSGDSTTAVRDAEEVVAVARDVANPHIAGVALAMAAYALADTEPQRALALVREALAFAGDIENNVVWSIAGDLAARLGEQRDALDYFGHAVETLHWMGNRTVLGTILVRVAALLADRDPEAAALLLAAGDARAPEFGHSTHHLAARDGTDAVVESAIHPERRRALRDEGMAMSDADVVACATAAIARYLADAAS